MRSRYLRHTIISIGLSSICIPVNANEQLKHESSTLRVKLSPRAPQQISAFYEARGFDSKMLNKIKQYCFITVYIKNKSNNIIWHNLDNWHFSQGSKPLKRLRREQLLKQWQTMNIPQAHQSTFRWTLLPEKLDFRPNEGEGGNIVFLSNNQPFNLTARFHTQKNNGGDAIEVNLKNIQCAK